MFVVLKPETHRLVMLVDDCPTDNFINKKMIEKYHFSQKVLAYSKPEDALYYLSSNADKIDNTDRLPSLIFLDLNMPEVNGKEFLEHFSKLNDIVKSYCKIIILSNTLNPAEMSMAIQNEYVLTFINKPLMKSNLELISSLGNPLQGYKMQS